MTIPDPPELPDLSERSDDELRAMLPPDLRPAVAQVKAIDKLLRIATDPRANAGARRAGARLDAPSLESITSAGFMRGFVDIEAEQYFADPCAVPSLSASIAKVIDEESPLHAWTRHPRLGGMKRKATNAMNNGSLSHALLLGKGKDIEVIDASDYRTKAAQQARDAASEAGKIPVLADAYEEAREASDTIRQRFAEKGIVLDGASELSAFWTERLLDGTEVQCRGMLDHMTLPRIVDVKSTKSAKPDACRRSIETYGYAIQHAAYVSAVEHIRPDLAGRVDFIFAFYETEPPFDVVPVRLSGAFRQLGERAWKRAVETWERCLRTAKWPGYVSGVIELEPSPWTLTRDMEKQIASALDGGADIMAD